MYMYKDFYKHIKYKTINDVKILMEDRAFHKGDITDPSRSYGGGTDSLFRMDGRGTGHFGSGVYLATYRGEDINKERYYHNIFPNEPPYKKVSNGLYLFDLDRYNLYKPVNSEHADMLFELLKDINALFYTYYNYDFKINDLIKKRFLSAKAKANLLDLTIDFSFLKFAKRYGEYYEKYRFNSPKNYVNPSLSTLFMEMNGYNGVNVSSIESYDNTLHGSVIYDIEKYDTEIKPSKFKYDDKFNGIDKLTPYTTQTILKNFPYKNLSKLSVKDVILLFNSLEENKLPSNYDLEYMLEKGNITKEQYNILIKLLEKKNQQLDKDDENYDDY